MIVYPRFTCTMVFSATLSWFSCGRSSSEEGGCGHVRATINYHSKVKMDGYKIQEWMKFQRVQRVRRVHEVFDKTEDVWLSKWPLVTYKFRLQGES